MDESDFIRAIRSATRFRHTCDADAIYEALRRHGAKEGVLCAWCITSDGSKLLLHLAVGNKESEVCWTEFLRNMVGRGLKVPSVVEFVTAAGGRGVRTVELLTSPSTDPARSTIGGSKGVTRRQ